jgi:hypothetical protein
MGLYGNWNYSSNYSKKFLFMTPCIPEIIPKKQICTAPEISPFV